MFQHVLFVDPSISLTDHTAKGLQNAKSFHKFFKNHCHCSHYVFQIKKCDDDSCFYCLEHPIRLPREDFSKLSFLPLPLLAPSKEHYQKFDILYGKPPSEDRPSCVPTPSQETKDNDNKNSAVLVSAKVRACIQCGECHKARCVYSQCRRNLLELNEISRIKESNIYTCGSILFPPGSKYENSIIVRGSHLQHNHRNSVL